MKSGVMEEVKRIFKPEFMNRIDEMLVFRMLNKEDMKKIVALMTKNLVERCKIQMDIQLVIRDTAKAMSWKKRMIRNLAPDRYVV